MGSTTALRQPIKGIDYTKPFYNSYKIGDPVFLITNIRMAEEINKYRLLYDGKVSRSVWWSYLDKMNKDDYSYAKKDNDGRVYYFIRTTYIGYVKEKPINEIGSVEERSWKVDWFYRPNRDNLLPGEKDSFTSWHLAESVIPLNRMQLVSINDICIDLINNDTIKPVSAVTMVDDNF